MSNLCSESIASNIHHSFFRNPSLSKFHPTICLNNKEDLVENKLTICNDGNKCCSDCSTFSEV